MSERKKAMNPNFKDGGKVAHKALGGMIGKIINPLSPKANQVIPLMAKQALPTTSGNLQLPAKMPGKMMANPPMRPPIAGGNMAGMLNKLRPGMKKGGKAGDMAQDKAMIKKAFKQHDMQEHKGDKGTDLKLKKGGKMAMGGSVDTAQNMPNRLGSTGGVPARQGGYKKGGAVETGSINTNTTKMVTTAGKAPLGKFKDGGSVGSYANTKMMTAENLRQKLGKSGDVKIGAAGYKKGGMVKDMC